MIVVSLLIKTSRMQGYGLAFGNDDGPRPMPNKQPAEVSVSFFYGCPSVSSSRVWTIAVVTVCRKDPREVIIDEFIGQSIPIYLYEISHGTEKSPNEALIFYGICFVLFRFFDIAKPFPVNFFDKNFKNSFGVIMDDVCAGFYVVLSLICFMVLKSYLI